MVFWGIELKPGKPYKHRHADTRRRLHISQATLGFGQFTMKSVVQCNIGNKSPVLLCSLLPDKIESCPLNLEFEENDEVIFSILGPRSVHLTGFYLESGCNFDRHGSDSESYGEDIGETETERSSNYDTEDKYDSDFIDDGDLKVLPPSPKSQRHGRDDDDKPVNKSRTIPRRLKKKYQISDSDDGDGSQQQIAVKCTRSPVLESEEENGLLISTIIKSKHDATNGDAEEGLYEKKNENGMKDKTGGGNQGVCLKRKIDSINQDDKADREADQPSDPFEPSGEVVAHTDRKSKKRNKEKVNHKIEKVHETEVRSSGNQATDGSKHEKTVCEEQIINMDQDLPVKVEPKEKPSGDKVDDRLSDSFGPSGEVAAQNDGKSKKKKKEKVKNGSILETEERATEGRATGGSKNEKTVSEEKIVNTDDDHPVEVELKDQLSDVKGANQAFDFFVPSDEVATQNSGKSKKKKKEKVKNGNIPETEEKASGDRAIGGSRNEKTVLEDNIDQDLPVGLELKDNLSHDKGTDQSSDPIWPFGEAAAQNDGKSKKKKKERVKNEKALEAEERSGGDQTSNGSKNDETLLGINTVDMDQDLLAKVELEEKVPNVKGPDQPSDSFVPSGEIAAQNWGKLKKKKKEKIRNEKILETEERASVDQATDNCKSDVPTKLKTELEVVHMEQDMHVGNKPEEKPSNNNVLYAHLVGELIDSGIPSEAVAPESTGNSKKKKKIKGQNLQPEVEAASDAVAKDCGDGGNKQMCSKQATIEMMDRDAPSNNAQEPNTIQVDEGSLAVKGGHEDKKKKKTKSKMHD